MPRQPLRSPAPARRFRLLSLSASLLLALPLFANPRNPPRSGGNALDKTQLDRSGCKHSGFNGYTATRSSSRARASAADIKEIPLHRRCGPAGNRNDFAVLTFNQQETLASVPGVSATEKQRHLQPPASTKRHLLPARRLPPLRPHRPVERRTHRGAERPRRPPFTARTLRRHHQRDLEAAKPTPEYSLELQSGGLDPLPVALSATGPLIPGKLL